MIVVAVGEGGPLHPAQVDAQKVRVAHKEAGCAAVQEIGMSFVVQMKREAVFGEQVVRGGIFDEDGEAQHIYAPFRGRRRALRCRHG